MKNICIMLLTMVLISIVPRVMSSTDAVIKDWNNLSVDQICAAFGERGEYFAQMYQMKLSEEEMISIMIEVFDKDSREMAFVPGFHKMAQELEWVKSNKPEMFELAEFAEKFGRGAFKACMEDRGRGWIQNVPGVIKFVPPSKGTLL